MYEWHSEDNKETGKWHKFSLHFFLVIAGGNGCSPVRQHNVLLYLVLDFN